MLLHLSNSGLVHSKHLGKFDCVKGNHTNVFARTSKPCKLVEVFTLAESIGFSQIRSIKIDDATDKLNVLYAFDSFLYLVNGRRSGEMLVHKYAVDGSRIWKFDGANAIHRFYLRWPRVLDVDGYGNVLFLDKMLGLTIQNLEDQKLLDNTVIAWLPELADSWHGMDNFATVVAGGRNSLLRTGRYIMDDMS